MNARGPARRALLVLSCALAAGGCRIDPDYSGTEYLCPDGVCPPGFQCVAGRCVVGDGGSTPACGSTANLHEEFSAGTLPEWAEEYTEGAASVAFENDRAVLRLPDDPVGDPAAHLSTRWRYDLRGDALTMEVAAMLDPTEPAAATFLVHHTWGDYAEFLQQQGMLAFNLWIDDIRISNTQVTYDPAEHRWWRYREAGGSLHWETSPDGTSWTTRSSVTTPFFVRRARIFFDAEAYSGATVPGAFEIERLNGGSPAPGWCSAESSTDDFDDGELGLDWDPFQESCTLSQPSGRVRFEPEANSASSCGLGATTLFDLRDSFASIEVPTMVATTGGAIVYLRAATDAASVDLAQQGGNLEARICTTDCATEESVSYDATAHRWWRIREASGTVYWETSPEGTSWTALTSTSAPFDMSAISVLFGVTVQSPEPSPGAAEFDNYNLTL